MDNFGGYQLIDGHNYIVAGEKFNLNADDVMEFCKQWAHREPNGPSCSRLRALLWASALWPPLSERPQATSC